MHITITNENDEIVGVLCINRDTQTCVVLQGDIEYLEDLSHIGAAMKAPKILLFVPPGAVAELLPYGWKFSEDLVVMEKGRS